MISSVLYFEKDHRVIFHSNNVKEIRGNFKPGFYQFSLDNEGVACSTIAIDEVHTPYKSSTNDEIIKGVMSFFSSKKLKKQINMMGFPHKMGVLLYGKPGTGKTTLINYISHLLFEQQNAIIMVCNNAESVEASIAMAKSIREIQNNPIVMIMDEFERFVANNSQEARIKTFLDGGDSIDNCLVLGATNYIEQVPKSIGERESRIRILKEITGVDTKEEVADIVNGMLNEANVAASINRDKIIDGIGTGITLDFIKNAVIDALMGKKIKSDAGRNRIGFAQAAPEEEEEAPLEELLEFMFSGSPTIHKANTYRKLGSDSNVD